MYVIISLNGDMCQLWSTN